MITYYTHELNILSSSGFDFSEFLSFDRSEDYDPELWWDETSQEWVATVIGGGNYNQHLIAISEDGDIYFG